MGRGTTLTYRPTGLRPDDFTPIGGLSDVEVVASSEVEVPCPTILHTTDLTACFTVTLDNFGEAFNRFSRDLARSTYAFIYKQKVARKLEREAIRSRRRRKKLLARLGRDRRST